MTARLPTVPSSPPEIPRWSLVSWAAPRSAVRGHQTVPGVAVRRWAAAGTGGAWSGKVEKWLEYGIYWSLESRNYRSQQSLGSRIYRSHQSLGQNQNQRSAARHNIICWLFECNKQDAILSKWNHTPNQGGWWKFYHKHIEQNLLIYFLSM